MCDSECGNVGALEEVECFFFKQKTAYEMRISDWSSDVCSSDLATSGVVLVKVNSLDGHVRVFSPIRAGDGSFQWLSGTGADPEIGRASCRERVCQYV